MNANAIRKSRRPTPALAVAAACIGMSSLPAAGIVSSNGGTNPPYSGINISGLADSTRTATAGAGRW